MLYPASPFKLMEATMLDKLAIHMLVTDAVRRREIPVALTDQNGRAANAYRLKLFFQSMLNFPTDFR